MTWASNKVKRILWIGMLETIFMLNTMLRLTYRQATSFIQSSLLLIECMGHLSVLLKFLTLLLREAGGFEAPCL